MTLRLISKYEQLNIGAGTAPDPAMVNADLYPGEGIDVVFDLEKEWPIKPESLSYVYCSHVLEHLRDHIGFFGKLYRSLKMGGKVSIRVPYCWNQAAWWDPTHVRPWTHESFCFVQPGYGKLTRNLFNEQFDFAFWITNSTVVCSRTWARLHRFNFGLWHRFLHRIARHLINCYIEVFVDLVKTTVDDPRSTTFGGDLYPNLTPIQVASYKHQMYGLPDIESGKMCELVVIP